VRLREDASRAGTTRRLPGSSHRGSGGPDPRPEPVTDGVIERFFGTLKYEHLCRAPIDDGAALAMKTARFRDIYNRIRPHQALDDRTPRQAYLDT
jgi:transposase InsO family protein